MSPSGGIDFKDIKDELVARVGSLAKDIVPDGWRAGDYWIGSNPTRADKTPGSFWIRVSGKAIGAWRDEAGVRGVDDGDLVDLVGYWKNCKGDRKETRRACLKWLGWASGPDAAPPSPAERAARDAERAAQAEREGVASEAERQKNAGRALALWLKAQKLDEKNFAGSLPDRFLRGRGIDLVGGWIGKGERLPGALRFFPAHDYVLAGNAGRIALPCMIALMTGPDGKARGIHRTWLKGDGSGKAELPDPKKNKARKIWPSGWESAVIRIAKGADRMTPEEAARQGVVGPLVVTEGIEDGLAVMLAKPDRRVWAAGTLGNLAHVPIDLPAIEKVTIAADNDWDKPQAQAQLERAIAALRSHGKPVFVARAPARFKDMNDLLKGEKI